MVVVEKQIERTLNESLRLLREHLWSFGIVTKVVAAVGILNQR